MDRRELGEKINLLCQGTGFWPWGQPATTFERKVMSNNLELLEEIVIQMRPLIPKEAEFLAGIDRGGVMMATRLSELAKKPLVILEKDPKTKMLVEIRGESVSGKRVLMIDDTVAYGRKAIGGAKLLELSGAEVVGIVCAVERGPTPPYIKEAGLKIQPLFTNNELKMISKC